MSTHGIAAEEGQQGSVQLCSRDARMQVGFGSGLQLLEIYVLSSINNMEKGAYVSTTMSETRAGLPKTVLVAHLFPFATLRR